jgi:nucleoside-diphosphate-sugar epimerase
MSAQKRFVVVGAGQVGMVLAKQLAADGDVVVVSRTPKAGVNHVARDVLTDNLDDVFAGATTVFVAINVAYDAKLWASTLPLANKRIADAAQRCGARLVVLENLYVYGADNADRPLREDMPYAPSSKKGVVRTQIARELYERNDDLRVTSLRPPDFWGPGLSSALLDDAALRRILAGKPLFAVGDVDTVHARAFVDDVAAAMRTLGLSDDPAVYGRAWHAPSIHVTTRELVSAIAAAANVKDPGVRVLPRFAWNALAFVVPILSEIDEMMYLWDRPHLVDDGAFRARFAVVPTSLEDGARACVDALQARRAA